MGEVETRLIWATPRGLVVADPEDDNIDRIFICGTKTMSKIYNLIKRMEQNGTFKPEKEL